MPTTTETAVTPNPVPDVIQASIQKESGFFVSIGASRVSTGIQLTLKSERLEAFFREYNAEASADTWQERQGYLIQQDYRNEHGRFHRWGSSDLFIGEQANLSFFLGKGLSEGYTVVLTNNVATLDLVSSWVQKAKLALASMYKKYMAPFSIEVVVSFREF